MAPESNQTSISSGVRFIVPLHFSHINVTGSTDGLCKSSGCGKFFPCFNSSTLPTHFRCPHFSHTQIGSGVPQYRSRDSAQSLFSSSQLPKRPEPVSAGIQLICLFNSIILGAYFVVLMYHDSRA